LPTLAPHHEATKLFIYLDDDWYAVEEIMQSNKLRSKADLIRYYGK